MEATWRAGDSVALARMRRRLTPNVLLRVFVPDSDRHCRALPQLELVAHVEVALTRINGGFTTLRSGQRNGRWADAKEGETTVIVESYLPEIVGTTTRKALLLLIEALGRAANQKELLVAVGSRCCRIRFEEDENATATAWVWLRGLAAVSNGASREVALRAG